MRSWATATLTSERRVGNKRIALIADVQVCAHETSAIDRHDTSRDGHCLRSHTSNWRSNPPDVAA